MTQTKITKADNIKKTTVLTKHTIINVARDFSKYPGGRYRKDGVNSAQRLREDFLVPALINNETATIDLGDILGFSSAFLEEAFGGLIRSHGFTFDYLREHLSICKLPQDYIDKAWQYIKEADSIVRIADLIAERDEAREQSKELAQALISIINSNEDEIESACLVLEDYLATDPFFIKKSKDRPDA